MHTANATNYKDTLKIVRGCAAGSVKATLSILTLLLIQSLKPQKA